MAKLDLNSLDDEHVKLLINELKYPKRKFQV
ncbi:hypothetical protein PJFE503_101538 [Staphylococcus aureus]